MNRIAIVAALLALALTACGKKAEAPAAAVAPTPVAAAASAPVAAPAAASAPAAVDAMKK